MKNSVREHRTDKDFGPLFSGELLRDEAIVKVSDNNESWLGSCICSVENHDLWEGGNFTGEEIRFLCYAQVGSPTHPNAWGALVNTLVRRKIIRPTGEYRAMKDENSHARRTPVYTK